MVLGALLIGSVSGPIVAYFLFVSPQLQSPTLISPLPPEAIAPFVQRAQAAPIVYSQLDYRKPENWFPGAELPKPNPAAAVSQYSLSIPALGIQDARVEIGGSDLSKSLIHYPGTANPGELGSPVIFGHSILRQFYNPRNYMAIFSTIMTLKAGDRITVTFDGVQYRYRVIDKIEVKPTDIQILQQKYSGRYLKLVTCVPEGTYLRRGVIIGELERA
jgi:sortase A